MSVTKVEEMLKYQIHLNQYKTHVDITHLKPQMALTFDISAFLVSHNVRDKSLNEEAHEL